MTLLLMSSPPISNDVITNVFSTNQHFASTFSVHVLKFQRRICKLSFHFRPPERPGELACRLVRSFFQHALHVARIQFQTQAQYPVLTLGSGCRDLKGGGSACRVMYMYVREYLLPAMSE